MKLSELYRQKLEFIECFHNKANAATNPSTRAHFRTLALGFQGQAGLIAHCLAYYGDQPITALPIQELMTKAEGLACEGENPWVRGLRVIQHLLSSSSSPPTFVQP